MFDEVLARTFQPRGAVILEQHTVVWDRTRTYVHEYVMGVHKSVNGGLTQRLVHAIIVSDTRTSIKEGSEMAWFTGGGINWCWYLCANVNEQEGTIEILLHDRLHNDRDAIRQSKIDPDCIGNFRIIETEGRIASEVVLTTAVAPRAYRVTNPKCLFNYGRFE